jgi:hypothetical protein
MIVILTTITIATVIIVRPTTISRVIAKSSATLTRLSIGIATTSNDRDSKSRKNESIEKLHVLIFLIGLGLIRYD